jgi:prolyl-tRNA editing enzyme YbaK/EbsC (Cys-tRNA(Pro) deacylase)
LNSHDLQRYIQENGVAAEILPMAEDTPTVPDAARALGVREQQIIKSLVFLVDGRPVLVIANGTARVEDRLIAIRFAVGRKRVRLARPEEALDLTGYVVGSMPPFGHRSRLPALVDPGVLAWPEIFGGGGDVDALLRLSPDELLRVTGAEIVSVTRQD